MKEKNNLRKTLSVFICVACCSLFVSCGNSNTGNADKTKDNESGISASEIDKKNGGNNDDDYAASRDIFAMDTYMTVKAYGSNADEAVEEAIKEIERLDGMLSATDKDSEIYKLNMNQGGSLSEDVSYLIERSKEIYESTEGTFNIAIYPIVEKWGFASGDYNVPTQDELNELLKDTDFSKVNYDKNNQSLLYETETMKIDLGGIAKGYTSARIMDIFKDLGVTSGIVNLGGNVQVLGTKTDGSDWKVAIQDPLDEDSYIGVLKTHDKAVITSGGYERYFEKDGVRYHHIIDPKTGYPADSGLISVTIVCSDGTMADCLSTSLFIMGKDEAIAYWKKHSSEFDTILYTENNELLVTEGIADQFTSELNITIINDDK